MANKKRRKTKSALSGSQSEVSELKVRSEEAIPDSEQAGSELPRSASESVKPEKQVYPEISEHDGDMSASESQRESEKTLSTDEPEEGEEIILSEETLAEIGSPDKELVFKRVAKAYEEAKNKREKYKKVGPIFVFVSGVAFLTLIFTLANKITFLILWVITILFTVALMIRAEYKYHQFQTYLGLTGEDSEDDSADGEDDTSASEEQKKDEFQNAEQEKQA